MGDPRRLKKKYETPGHPWQKARIESEAVVKKEFGLKNKKEMWKMETKLKHFASQAKRLISASGTQADKERKQLFERLERLGLLPAGSALDDILSLGVNNIMERRLQTVVQKKGLARSVKQARQFITHNHIIVDGKIVNAPSYLVKINEESTITFVQRSALAKEDHPERTPPAPTGTILNPDKDAEDVKKEEEQKTAKSKGKKAKTHAKDKGAKPDKSVSPKEDKAAEPVKATSPAEDKAAQPEKAESQSEDKPAKEDKEAEQVKDKPAEEKK